MYFLRVEVWLVISSSCLCIQVNNLNGVVCVGKCKFIGEHLVLGDEERIVDLRLTEVGEGVVQLEVKVGVLGVEEQFFLLSDLVGRHHLRIYIY